MKFYPTPIADVVEVQVDWHRDERGSFGRVFCRRKFVRHGLNAEFVQCNFSSNPRSGTLRGFHLQLKPHLEAKLVQCVSGRIYDVALDLRPGSATYGLYHAVELVAGEGRMLYLPEGCAHAYQTLEDQSSIVYHVSAYYERTAECGVRWNDPSVGVPWPLAATAIVSERDRALPLLAELGASG